MWARIREAIRDAKVCWRSIRRKSLSPLTQKRQRGRYYKSPVRDGIEQEGCLGAVAAIEEHRFLQPGLGKKGTERINTLTSLSSHPLISHQCMPLAKPNQKPEGKGAHVIQTMEGVASWGTGHSRKKWSMDLGGGLYGDPWKISIIFLSWARLSVCSLTLSVRYL